MEREAKFTGDQLRANDSAVEDLIELIKSGDAILMAGAGCSGHLYPAWGAFIEMLEQSALEIDPGFVAEKDNFLIFADRIKECLQDERYYTLIYNTFKPSEPTHLSFHEALCRLPFKAITTTNYDRVLENALTVVTRKMTNSLHFEGTTKSKIHEFLRSLNFNRSLEKMVVHLHGVCDNPDSIVLGGKEYSSKYGFEITANEGTLLEQLQAGELTPEKLKDLLTKYGYEWPLRRKLLWSLLATRRIVFVGFSMSDPYFLKMLEFVKADLSTYNSDSHFLILRVTPSSIERSIEHSRRLKREYGITTVFFQDDDGKYSGIEQFIAELENRVNRGEVAAIGIRKPEDTVEVEPAGDKSLTDKLFAISKKRYTDEN